MTTYIINTILCSAVFVLTYKLLLEKVKMLGFNRFYLLSGLLLSFIIPAIQFSYSASLLPAPDNEIVQVNILQDNRIHQLLSPAEDRNYSFPLLTTIYVTVTTLLFIRFIRNLKKVISEARNNAAIPYKNSKIVLINEDLSPHSFLNYLFLNKREYANGNIEDEVLVHEYAHIRQRHSYDILVLEILQTVYWFNPFIFLYKKAIQLNHEFQADEAVIHTYQNVAGYQYLLIDKAGKNKTSALTSRFNYSITKKRLIMLTKTKSFSHALCRQVAIIPVLAISIFMFSKKTFAQDTIAVPKTKQRMAPSTQEGVSQELLHEYEQIVSKTYNAEGIPSFNKFSDEDKKRLQSIFLSMSKDQQAKQIIIFTPVPPPLPRVVPTTAQIESWKNPKIYGLWINNKRVSNSALNKHQNTDFAQVFVSKLAKNTVNYGKHYYQVDLMTTEVFENYYKKALEESKNKYHMGIRLRNKQGKMVEHVIIVT